MKPPAFEYAAPLEIEHVLELLANFGDEAKILAGGQSLGPMLNLRATSPKLLIDINDVAGIDHLVAGDGLTIGANTRQSTLEDLSELARHQPLIARAIPHIAHRPIRNRGTVGGSLAHADPAAEWGALALALDARMVILRRGRTPRELAANDFFSGWMETAIEDDELLSEIRIPDWPDKAGCAFLELARRHGDFALAGVACRLATDASGRIATVRLAMIGIGDRPLRIAEAEKMLVGEQPDTELFRDAAEKATASLEPPSDQHASAGYRKRIAAVLVRDALSEALHDLERKHQDAPRSLQFHNGPPHSSKVAGSPTPEPHVEKTITLIVNGERISSPVTARTTLADFLRHGLGLTGTHVGCEHGVCGACTVIVDDQAQRSCIRYAVQCHGAVVQTVEGLADEIGMHPLQRAFGEQGALQCGFCTPGFLMTSVELVNRGQVLDETEVRQALSGSLCRCTGYEPIIKAVMGVLAERQKKPDLQRATIERQSGTPNAGR